MEEKEQVKLWRKIAKHFTDLFSDRINRSCFVEVCDR